MKQKNQGYIIRISENSLIQMCLSGLEAYCISHGSTNKVMNELETLGQLWGHEVRLPNNQILYCVELATVDTSAIRKKNAVKPKEEAFELKRDILTSFWPQYDFIGDFHTHPYEDYKEVVSKKLYEFSQDDFESIENDSEKWRQYNYRVGLVLTIAGLKKKSSKNPQWLSEDTIEFSLGNYRLWLKGYVTKLNSNNELEFIKDGADVIIDCPSIVGLIGEYSAFGRLERNLSGVVHKSGEI